MYPIISILLDLKNKIPLKRMFTDCGFTFPRLKRSLRNFPNFVPNFFFVFHHIETKFKFKKHPPFFTQFETWILFPKVKIVPVSRQKLGPTFHVFPPFFFTRKLVEEEYKIIFAFNSTVPNHLINFLSFYFSPFIFLVSNKPRCAHISRYPL